MNVTINLCKGLPICIQGFFKRLRLSTTSGNSDFGWFILFHAPWNNLFQSLYGIANSILIRKSERQ